MVNKSQEVLIPLWFVAYNDKWRNAKNQWEVSEKNVLSKLTNPLYSIHRPVGNGVAISG